jgi:zinc protease
MRIARCSEPLIVRKVAAGTEFAIDQCAEGIWYSELDKGKAIRKEKGSSAVPIQGPEDSTEALVKTLTEYKADCFITSGHATERDWQIGYRYRNGSLRCRNGILYGLNTQGKEYPIQSPNPKVYMAVGNCLMGHIDGADAMALAFMNSAGVNQMFGYTVNSWYGYMGWGCLDYFLEQPGRYTFTEAFFANQAALMYRLDTYFPGLDSKVGGIDSMGSSVTVGPEAGQAGLTVNDARGLLYDRDTVAFYGDPAWEVRMARADLAWEQTLTEKEGTWTFDITPNLGEKTFEPVNRNGSQRGGRPLIQFFPRRLKNIRIQKGSELKPVLCEDFILVPNPQTCAGDSRFRVVFSAEPL